MVQGTTGDVIDGGTSPAKPIGYREEAELTGGGKGDRRHDGRRLNVNHHRCSGGVQDTKQPRGGEGDKAGETRDLHKSLRFLQEGSKKQTAKPGAPEIVW